MAGKLFVCATPIGNLSDITLRAIETLKSADLVAAEDTRHTKILFNKYGIKTKLVSFHKFSGQKQRDLIIAEMLSGKNAALVSDSGTPTISDPGENLVQEAIKNKIEVVSIPGPSAVIAALSVSGLDASEFSFVGFLPKQAKGKKEILGRLIAEGRAFVFYESPLRVKETLRILNDAAPQSFAAAARELTKKFEEVMRGTPKELLEIFDSRDKKGEFVIVVRPAKLAENKEVDLSLARECVKAGLSVRDASAIFSKHLKIPKKLVYKELIKR